MCQRPGPAFRTGVVAIAAALVGVLSPWLVRADEPRDAPTTWDGRHPIARIDATVVYFVPADRVPLPDWRARADWFARRLEAFHAREFQGRSVLGIRVIDEPLVSRLSTAALRLGDANAIFHRTMRETDERLAFARAKGDGFPVLVVLSDINWRPLDDFHRLAPTGSDFVFEGTVSAQGIHVPGVASGGSRALHLAEAGKGWGLVSADGWRVPYRGSDCVVYHEGIGHAIGLPHPPNADADVMSHGQYRVTLGQSWVDAAQKRVLGWQPVADFDGSRHALFSGFTATPEPAVPRPGEPVMLRLGLPEGIAVDDLEVELQTALRGPWARVPLPDGAATSTSLVPLGRFDRPCPVSWRVRVRRLEPIGGSDDVAELWGYLQVRDEPGTPPPAADIDPLDRAPPSDTPTQAGPAIDLLAAVDPERDAVSGQWSLAPAGSDGGARLTVAKGFGARLELPTAPPEEYRLTVVAEPLDEPDGLILGQRSGDRRFLVLLGFSPQGPQVGALENVDGGNVFAAGNPTRIDAELFVRGRPAWIECTVRRDGVAVHVDGRRWIEWKGDRGRLSLSDYWQTPSQERLFLGGYDCSWRFHRVTLEPLDDTPRAAAASASSSRSRR